MSIPPVPKAPGVQRLISAEDFSKMEEDLRAAEQVYKEESALLEGPAPNREDALRAILRAHKLIGGDVALAEWALHNKDLFYTKLFIKALPATTQNVEVSGGMLIKHVLPRTALDGPPPPPQLEDSGPPIEGESYEVVA